MTARSPRADAQRSRERLLAAALQLFTTQGTAASMDGVARAAGVGNATLYRHFPTREALVEAVYRQEIQRVVLLGAELQTVHLPPEALRFWMRQFVTFMATKHGMADVFRAVIADGGDPYGQTRQLVFDTLQTLMAGCTGNDALRPDIDPLDVLTHLNGLAYATDDDLQIGRLIDLLLGGLRRS